MFKKTLDKKFGADRANKNLKWGIVNTTILAILIINLLCENRSSDTFCYWLYHVMCGICMLNAITYYGVYLQFIIRKRKEKRSEVRKRLLNKKNYNSLKVEKGAISPAAKVHNETKNKSSLIVNWHSSFESPYKRNSIGIGNAPFVSAYAQSTRDDFIESERDLNAYLSKDSPRKHSIPEAHDMNQSSTGGSANSIENYCDLATQMLKTNIYQLASEETFVTQHQQSVNEDVDVVHFIGTDSEEIRSIPTEKLLQYVGSLRMWLSNTILKPLVSQIEDVNRIFLEHGLADMTIGVVELERLCTMAENQQFVSQLAPTLPFLLPFLDLCINQEYLVRRIKDLAEGSCMADFRWNSGGSYNGQEWGDHLPNDTAIIFHLFCVYLDSQLMPLPQGAGRPFHSRYVIAHKDKRSAEDTIADVNNKAQCAILYTDTPNPNLYFISDKEIHNFPYKHNNLFYVIIIFLRHMRTHHRSMLEGIHLGKWGINIMNVIKD